MSDANYNHRVGPDTGANGAMTPDGDLQGGVGATRIVHAAYTNSGLSTSQPTATTLYALDLASGGAESFGTVWGAPALTGLAVAQER